MPTSNSCGSCLTTISDIDSRHHDEEEPALDAHGAERDAVDKNPALDDVDLWIQQQAQLAAQKTNDKIVFTERSASSNTLVVDGEEDVANEREIPTTKEESITFYQGFKAAFPKLTKVLSRGSASSSPKLKPLLIAHPQIVPSPPPSTIAGSALTQKLPSKARHQVVAINNIAKLFNGMLREREVLMDEVEETEQERVRFFLFFI